MPTEFQAKPTLDTVWGSTGATTDPGATKMNLGWTSEIPTHQVQNFWQQRSDEMLTHLNEQGIAEWDAVTVYPLHAWVRGSDGEVYRALDDSEGEDPLSSPTEWTLNLGGSTTGNNANGYFRIDADGTIQQWGEVAISSSSTVVTFPTTFTTAASVKIAITTEWTGTGGMNEMEHILDATVTTSGFTASTFSSHDSFHWIATGV